MGKMIQNSSFEYNSNNKNNLQTIPPEDFGKVVVLFGGRSAERKVSLESGQACLEALLRQGVDAHPVDIDDNLVNTLKKGKFDRAFIMLHGKEGEDGSIQALLEFLRIPYTGSGVGASSLAMDKARSKLVMQALGIPTPVFGLATSLEEAQYLAQQIGTPLSIKPNAEGSSIGVTHLLDLSKLNNAYMRAAQYGEVIIEKWIDGQEIFVSLLGDEILPFCSVKAADGFYDYNAKYESALTQYTCPMQMPLEKEQELQMLSYKLFKGLGCDGWARMDVIQDKQQKFWFLEANTIPGMTSHSLVPQSAKARGMSFDDLVMAILATSLNRHQTTVGKLAQI